MEMLERGFTRVGELHYLHHSPDGSPYADVGEMSLRIAVAAAETGIRLTLLPSFYAHSGFGGLAPHPGQRRFICDSDRFVRLFGRAIAATASLPGAGVGLAPHSLRAVTPEELAFVLALHSHCPVHIHAAEQVREVDDCIAWSGRRPVAWLLEHHDLDGRWCLIHATHLDPEESRALARSGATAGLCPVTESNLGDGIFPGPAFLADRGRYGAGTDSNVRIGGADELRQLEYAQRLGARQRNVMAAAPGSTARSLFDGAMDGGARALGAAPAHIGPFSPDDFVSLEPTSWTPTDGDAVLDAWIFAGEARVADVWAAGAHLVADGVHRERRSIIHRFGATMRRLDGV